MTEEATPIVSEPTPSEPAPLQPPPTRVVCTVIPSSGQPFQPFTFDLADINMKEGWVLLTDVTGTERIFAAGFNGWIVISKVAFPSDKEQ